MLLSNMITYQYVEKPIVGTRTETTAKTVMIVTWNSEFRRISSIVNMMVAFKTTTTPVQVVQNCAVYVGLLIHIQENKSNHQK